MSQTDRLYELLKDCYPHREWKSIAGYEALYFVSNDGNVARAYCNGKCKLVAQAINRGYKRVCLSKNNVRRNFAVHRLVALAFIPNPSQKRTVNHLDGDKFHNSFTNLEWATTSENNRHAFRNGLRSARGECNGQAKLTRAAVMRIRRSALPHRVIAIRFGISRNYVGRIRNHERWTHIA